MVGSQDRCPCRGWAARAAQPPLRPHPPRRAAPTRAPPTTPPPQRPHHPRLPPHTPSPPAAASTHHGEVLDRHAADLEAAVVDRALRRGDVGKGNEAEGAALECLLVAREVDVRHGAVLGEVELHHLLAHLLQHPQQRNNAEDPRKEQPTGASGPPLLGGGSRGHAAAGGSCKKEDEGASSRGVLWCWTHLGHVATELQPNTGGRHRAGRSVRNGMEGSTRGFTGAGA